MCLKNAVEQYEQWLSQVPQDHPLYKDLQELKNNQREIQECFGSCISFGTGGIRGIMGAGTNRMNSIVVGRTTEGLANYLLSQPNSGKKGVVIACDTRALSPEFSREAARVLASAGITVYLFEDCRPTPLLSFSVRYLKAQGGIVITASHNPPAYNGYKIYGEDGGQLVPSTAQEISRHIDKVPYKFIPLPPFKELQQQGLIKMVGEELDKAYLDCYGQHQIFSLNKMEDSSSLKIVYTPLHGTGGPLVKEILERFGFKNTYFVKEQQSPDSQFSTVATPNPEDERAFELALVKARELEADLILATDPDCDRVGVMIKGPNSSYRLLNGNELGALLLDYVLHTLKQNNALPPLSFVVKTVVTSDLGKEIAARYGVSMTETLTGFKYIGEQIELRDNIGGEHFVFGYEESGGYLAAPFVRDKDGVMGVLLICQLAAYHRERGLSLMEALQEIYRKYGYFKEKLMTVDAPGSEGLNYIKRIMEGWREEIPETIAGFKVCHRLDYSRPDTGLPEENSIKVVFDNGSWLCLRPSGTEPKLKIYLSARGDSQAEVEDIINSLSSEMAVWKLQGAAEKTEGGV
ncbi:phospho-sugar mutase [Candidatus Contubernalis alkaliaceticus]|uniref:phospho-sugar mutase n=1 Tax=Candidatus Contubernalis alkaliaceticus TaxID=338645 RepID=UPI001F4C19BD|nr:phospho-sugar mutase [Candidatus Contubernalis alkalaceticus]UNC93630.1 phospho-sugar mutase [Candidatus Contubernalis alkalaceticus]